MRPDVEVRGRVKLLVDLSSAIGSNDNFLQLVTASAAVRGATHAFLQQGHDPNDFSVKRHIVQHMESLREDAYLRWINDMSIHYQYVSSHVHFDWRSNTDDLVRMIQHLHVLRRRNPEITPVQEQTVMIVSLSLLKGQGFRDVSHFYESSAMLKDRSFVSSLLTFGQECHERIPARVELVMNRSTRSVRLPEVLSALYEDSAPVLSNGAL